MEKTALTEEKLSYIKNELEEIRSFDHGARIIEYDLVTVCPEGGREASGDIAVFLNELAFRKQTDPQFTEAVTFLYEKGSELSDLDQVLIRRLYREVLHNKNISPVLASENEKIKKQAWTTWVKAKREKDFSVFSDMLDAVLKSEIKRVSLWEPMEDELDFSTYDRLISEYEFGLRGEVLDQLFLTTRNKLVTLIKDKQSKNKQIRTDFLSRPVTDEQQRKISEYILEVMGFDKNRGTMGLTEHPFTNLLTKDDVDRKSVV